MVQRTGIQYYRLTVYFTTQAPTRSMSPPGRDARYIYQSARSLRLKTRLRLDQGARTAFLLIHAVLRLFTLGKCKRSFTHCCRENVLKFEMLRMARIINQGTKSTSKQTLFFTHRRDFSMQFVWGKMLFFGARMHVERSFLRRSQWMYRYLIASEQPRSAMWTFYVRFDTSVSINWRIKQEDICTQQL